MGTNCSLTWELDIMRIGRKDNFNIQVTDYKLYTLSWTLKGASNRFTKKHRMQSILNFIRN